MNGADLTDIVIFVVAIVTLLASITLGQAGLGRRLLYTFAVLFGASLLVTGLLRLVPGDPVDHLLGEMAPDYARLILAKDLGLVDENGTPLGFVAQYGHFMKGLFDGTLSSFRTREPVLAMIGGRIGHTFRLALLALSFSLLIGPLAGIVAALTRGRKADRLLQLWAVVFAALPRFALAPLLIWLFSLHFGLFPVSGADEGIISLILPAASLGIAMAAVQSRVLRASLLEVIGADYIRTARAKGCSPFQIYFKHALKNALLPLITLVGLEAGALLTGAVIIEKIFNLPGIGLLLLEGIQQLDFPVVQAVVLVIAFIYVVTNAVTALCYALADPRMRGESL